MENLAGSSSKLEHNFADVHQQTTKAVTDVIQHTVEEIRLTLKAPVQEYGRAIRGFTSNVDQHSKALTTMIDECTSAVKLSVGDVSDTLQQLVKKTGQQIASDTAALTPELIRIVDGLRDLADQLSSISSPAEVIEFISRPLGDLERHITSLCNVLAPDSQLVRNINSTAGNIETGNRRVLVAIDALATRLVNVAVPDQV